MKDERESFSAPESAGSTAASQGGGWNHQDVRPSPGQICDAHPEEFVRQHFTAWLRDAKHYPASLMANEIGIDVNGTRKRCDTVIFGKDGKPVVIVEYKAPDVAVNQAVFDQIVRYNVAPACRLPCGFQRHKPLLLRNRLQLRHIPFHTGNTGLYVP